VTFPVPVDFLRSLSNTLLPDVCSIQRATDTVTGDGTSQSWANVATGVACRVSARGRSASESVGGAGALRAATAWTIWLPALTDITVRDRIVVGSRAFEVQRVDAKSYETGRAALCTELT
jgi:head-tail adaptor